MHDLSFQEKKQYFLQLGVLRLYMSAHYGLLKRSDFLAQAGSSDINSEIWMILFGVDEVAYSPGSLFGGIDPANDDLFDRAMRCICSFELFLTTRTAFIERIENELPF